MDNKKAPPVATGPREKRLKSSEGSMPTHIPRRDGPECQPPPRNRVPAQKRPLFEQSTPTATNKPVLHVPTRPLALVPFRKSRGTDANNKPTHNSAVLEQDDLAVTLPHTAEKSVARCSRDTSYQNKSIVSLAEPKTEPECDKPGLGPLAVVHTSHVLDSSANSK
jgi:hypothetical protein